MAGGLELGVLYRPFQPKPFDDSMIFFPPFLCPFVPPLACNGTCSLKGGGEIFLWFLVGFLFLSTFHLKNEHTAPQKEKKIIYLQIIVFCSGF